MKKINTKQFIERSMKIHGDMYNYSKSIYTSLRKPLTITCKVHGDFDQLPSNHFNGSGCLSCANDSKKSGTLVFLLKAQKIHGELYDYSKTKLNGMNNKVTITCSTHGDFEQRAASHLNGSGCRLCNEKQKHTTDSFVVEVIKRHGKRYNYDKVNYVNAKTKVEIVCDKHGSFMQTPSDHLHGYGCPSCGGTKKKTTKEFISNANKTHNNYYTYDNVALVGMNDNVTITCPIHGDFEQRPADHVNGSGCSVCGRGKQGRYCEEFFINNEDFKYKQCHLYLISTDNFCKVGITIKPYIRQRFCGFDYDVTVDKHLLLYEAYQEEQRILEKFKHERFKIHDLKEMKHQSGWTECFPLSLLPQLKCELETIK